ncbi:hypothetical protein RAZWK3B_15508 [Roseobacter sp. AzwK-3b]|uniref:hypothetical protein n=1 Tax=Roseobacter sp. AzwK-3b TaxID=351016 RepID=UPI000156A4E2|nr:hypothetical protein [Roseobacter sp. AzwK-3b]EDM70817.1 hypothetical protein RAZWK3B_15508 [Roseobacter sp. AzwK-3b]
MTAQTRITTPQKAEQEASMLAMRRALMAAIDAADRVPGGQAALGEALCAALDTVGGGAPGYDAFGNMREDAAFWADVATPMELEIFGAAALKRIQRATFAHRARKRVFMALWETFTEADRKAFIQKVTASTKPP